MKNINNIVEEIGVLVGYVKNIFTSRTEYFKLSAIQYGSRAGGIIIFALIISLIIFMIFMFMFLALAAYIFTLVESMSIAFLIVSGILIVLALIIYLLRKPLIMNPLLNTIIRNVEDED